MGFFDLFKPKWKHSDAEVRVEAVRQLGPDDAGILTQIVKKDQDARVRRLAVKKLDDPEVLLDIARSDSDEGLRRLAQEKAEELLLSELLETEDEAAAQAAASRLGQKALLTAARRGKTAAIRQLAAELISDERHLGELARGSDDAELRTACLARITSEPVLRDVALGAPTRELGALALERIGDPALLKDLATRGKGKALRAAAEARLGGLSGQGPGEGAAQTAAPAPAGGKAGKKQKGQKGAGGGQPGRPSPAEAALEKRRRAQLFSLIQKVESVSRGGDLARASAEVAEATRQFDDLAEADDAPLRQRFDKAVSQLRDRQEAEARKAGEAQRLADLAKRDDERKARRAALCERVERLDGEGLPAQLLEAKAAWTAIGAVETDAERELAGRFARAIKDAMRRHEQADSRKAARGRLAEVVADLEALQGGGAQAAGPAVRRRLRELERRWQELESAILPGDELRARYEQALGALRRVEDEERARRQKEGDEARARIVALCDRLEGLAGGTDRKAADAALKDVGGAMKQIGLLPPAERDGVAERLRAARDRVVTRLHELREEEDWKRWSNVPHAEQLVAHVEALRERLRAQDAAGKAPDAESDTEAAAEAAAATGAEAAGEPAQADTGAGGAVEAAVEVAAVGIVAVAADGPNIVETVQAAAVVVAPHEAGAEAGAGPGEADATASAGEGQAPRPRRQRYLGPQALQRELQAARAAWKALGPLPKEKSEALWQRFKAVTDELSDRLRDHRAAEAGTHAENQKKKEALCQQAEALAESTDWKAASEGIKRLQAEWKETGPVATKALSDELWKRFRAACDRFFDRRKQHGEEEDKLRKENAGRLQALCQRAEALAESTDWREAAEGIKKLQAEWKETGPAPKAESEALWKRFRAACDRFFDRRKEHFEKLDAERAENVRQKEALILEVEQAFDNEEMGEQEAQEAVRAYMTRWKAIGPAPKEQSEALWGRFQKACDRLMLRQWLPPDLEPARFENRPLAGLAGLAELAGKLGQGAPGDAGEPKAGKPDKSGQG